MPLSPNVGSLTPFLVRDLGLDYAQIGILVGAFILPGVAISLPSGLLSRSLGDKRIVMDGYITRVPESLFLEPSAWATALARLDRPMLAPPRSP